MNDHITPVVDLTTLMETANALYLKRSLQAADDIYLYILKQQPEHLHARHFHYLIQAEIGDVMQALDQLEEILKQAPDNIEFHYNVAVIYSRHGESKRAQQLFHKAIDLKPDYADAYHAIADEKSYKDDDHFLEQIEKQLEKENLGDRQRSYLEFAAGKVSADRQEYDRAFLHYSRGNQFKSAHFMSEHYRKDIDSYISYFNTEYVEKYADWGLHSHKPIFVLGMPRSGTTLIEQILASHSQVYGAGECNDIHGVVRAMVRKSPEKMEFPECLSTHKHIDILAYATKYLEKLEHLSAGESYVINKMPANFLYIGLILMMFPNSRIIHSVRSPMDTCLSCYFQNFFVGQEYSFDLEDLAEFYNGYHRLMTHWKTIYPQKILDVKYENVVSDREIQVRRMLDFCGLDWEDACMSHETGKKHVITASKCQVRQPIYNTSVERWRHYEKHLQPLIDSLQV